MMDGHDKSDGSASVTESTEAVPSHLFRRQALEQLTSPEQLDHLMQITSPRSWLALGALVCVVATVLVWSVAGSVPAEATGQGILLRPPGIYQIQTAGAGMITDLRVSAGDTVRAGQAIATLTAPEGTETEITSRQDGMVLAVLVEQYVFVHPGTTVATVEPLTESMQAIVYVRAAQASDISHGMKAHVSPQAISAEQYGFLVGTVAAVSQYPASPEQIRRTVANEAIARTFADGEPVVEVRVDLVRDPATPSGFKWSASRGPSVQLASGMLCSVDIILSEQRPINLVFPTSNK
jgi:biotin carboxyl carrier protein